MESRTVSADYRFDVDAQKWVEIEHWSDEVPEPPKLIDQLHHEVRALTTYVKVLSESNHKAYRELRSIRKKLKDMGVYFDD
jgi:hypothetical protein